MTSSAEFRATEYSAAVIVFYYIISGQDLFHTIAVIDAEPVLAMNDIEAAMSAGNWRRD